MMWRNLQRDILGEFAERAARDHGLMHVSTRPNLPTYMHRRDVGLPGRPCALDDAAAREIRASADTGAALAKQYGVSVRTVWRIKAGAR